jgi:hypothetical protein
MRRTPGRAPLRYGPAVALEALVLGSDDADLRRAGVLYLADVCEALLARRAT